MERYFLGNNTAYGFVGNYETELKDKRKVILLKGGPGTGKSSMLKKIAAEAKGRGYDCELWYCSGDPESLDGVYVKELDTAVVDATAPHASGADLPKLKDFLYDLANSLSHSRLSEHREEIDKLLYNKKQHFIRAYQHLKVALCHINNQIEFEMQGLKTSDIRAYAAVIASKLRGENRGVAHRRKLFTHAICPNGEDTYYDHLRGKYVYSVNGSEAAKRVFFDELCGLLCGGTAILNPLDPEFIDGYVAGNTAVVSDIGHMTDVVKESVNLGIYDGAAGTRAIEEEKNYVVLHTAFAVEQLEKARENHLAAEKYFISAMDFENNGVIYENILKDIFGEK